MSLDTWFLLFQLLDSPAKRQNVREVLWQGLKMLEQPKSLFGFFRGYGELNPKFQMYNEQKANGTLTRENQNANNKSAEKA